MCTDVDVVVPCYNYGRFLVEAVESIAAQREAPRSVIVIDDGSTDETPQLMAGIAARFPDMTFLRQQHVGLAGTLRRGIAAGNSEFFAILSADDRWAPTFLERTTTLLRATPEAAYCYTQMKLFGEREGLFESREFTAGGLVGGNYVGAGALVRRAAYMQTTGYREIPALEDWDLWLSFLDRGLTGVLLAEPLYEWRQRSGSRNDVGRWRERALIWGIRSRHPRAVVRYGLPHRLARVGARAPRDMTRDG